MTIADKFTFFSLKQSGCLKLILGPVFSGKSSELIRRVRRYMIGGKTAVIVKYGTLPLITTHLGLTSQAINCINLIDIEPILKGYEVIGIDDGQFFSNISEFADMLANLGKIVIVAGLDGTFKRKPFGKILDLVPLSEEVIKLTAVCPISGESAPFSCRLSQESEIEILGGPERYQAISRSYFSKTPGSIQLILGPMFGGKSSEMLRRIRRYTISKRKCIVVKYSRDTRYTENECSTHDKVLHSAISCSGYLSKLDFDFEDIQVIGIDEGQFFKDLPEFCEKMANLGKIVIVAALDGTFERKPFGRILEVIPLAEDVIKLHAVCMITFKEAAFSKRISNEKEIEVIGGSDKYIAVSREGFFSN